MGRLRQPRPVQRRHLACGLRRQALRRHGPLPPRRLGLARVDEREPGRQDRPLRRRRPLGRLRPVARGRRPWAGWSSSAASSTPRRCTGRPASSATTGADSWQRCPLPTDGHRVVPLAVFNGYIYAGSYDSCSVYRFDGKGWEAFPALESSGQTYSFEVQSGELFVGTWPNGQVFRLDRGERWVPAGRLGEEKEVMGMAVHNGKLYAGTLPLAEVYRHDGGTRWTRTGRLDLTPDVRYRRAWSMAVFDGRLFCGTLPSGRVHALEVGQSVTLDRALAPGWKHLAAVREGGRLSLHVNGSTRRIVLLRPRTHPPLDLTNRSAPDRLRDARLLPRQPQRPAPL